jgi:hypothetical protein
MHPKIGHKYRDKISGFVGTATGRVEYISGCNQLLLCPTAKDGALGASEWFDEQRCEQVSDTERVVLNNSDSPGFDRAPPKR